MAVRRPRIKAVASIPVRKKATNNEKNSSKDSGADSISKEPIPDVVVNKAPAENKPSKECISQTSDAQETMEKSVPNGEENSSKEKSHRRRMMKPLVNIPPVSKKCREKAVIEISNESKMTCNPKRNKEPDSIHLEQSIDNSVVLNTKSPCNIQNENIYNTHSSNKHKKQSPLMESSLKRDSSKIDKMEKNKNVSIDGIRPLPPLTPTSNVEMSDAPALDMECNFDPIIPLPSPTKNRPKLRPMPRISTRRNSFQGSASESEDEIKRNKTEELPVGGAPNLSSHITNTPINARHRNDSNCFSADIPMQVSSSTPRQKSRCSTRGTGEARRAASRFRALQKVPQLPLTMCDLIYYNPRKSKSEIQPKSQEVVAPLNDNKESLSQCKVEASSQNTVNNEKPEEPTAMPVPQVKLGPNGEIVIDEQSLVIETTDAVKSREELSKLSVVYENGMGSGSKGMFRRSTRPRDWSNAETLRFYKALNTIGTDFALMISLFPGRTRKDLKIKFKREEKHNVRLVDKALMNPLAFDITELEESSKETNIASEKEKLKAAKREKKNCKRRSYRKSSLASRSMEIDENDTQILKTNKKTSNSTKQKTTNQSATVGSSAKGVSNNIQNDNQTRRNHMSSLIGSSPPPNVEPGSMVLLVNDLPGRPEENKYQAFITRIVDGKNKMFPINIAPEILSTIAEEMNIPRVSLGNFTAVDKSSPMKGSNKVSPFSQPMEPMVTENTLKEVHDGSLPTTGSNYTLIDT